MKNSKHRELLDTAFSTAARRVFQTIRCPPGINGIADEFFSSIPDEFFSACRTLNEYEFSASTFLHAHFSLRIEKGGTVYKISGSTESSYGNWPRPHSTVDLRRDSPITDALFAYCAEVYDVKSQVLSAVRQFESVTKRANTPAEVFYTLPLVKQFIANHPIVEMKIPVGRRPAGYNAEVYDDIDIPAVEKILLLAQMAKGLLIEPASARFTFDMVAKQTAPWGAGV
jgi:hypothetical protein